MKKTTIASIVLALMLAANAAAAATPAITKKKAAAVLKKDKLFRRNHNNDKKKRDDECPVITCLDEGKTCDDDDDTLICKDYLYCDNNKCTSPKSEGESCSSDEYECGGYLMCNVTGDDKIPRVCIPYPKKAGDSCSVHSDYCPTGTKCVYGVCTVYPTTVGADCVEEAGCDNNLYCNSEHKCAEYPKAGDDCLNDKCADHLYCDDESNKCVKYPGEGEDCYNNYYCDSGLCCGGDNKCVKLPGLDEKCDYSSGCASGLVCDYDQEICFNKIAGEGEYCSRDISCGDGLVCDTENKRECVVGNCKEDNDCPSGKGCHNFNCIEYMSLEDGEECIEDEGFFCKEDRGCGRNESSSTGYSCMKITTKISDEIECEDVDGCPSDSYCYCNSNNGKRQCIPYFVSNKTMLKYYEKMLTLEDEDYSEEYDAYSTIIIQYVYPADEETKCFTVDYSILEGDDSKSISSSSDEGIASNMKPSFTLSAVLFVFGLIAAML